jgi:hypothetical protein
MTAHRISFTLDKPLPLLNRMLRTGYRTRSKQRRALAWEIAAKIPYWLKPATPLRTARITVTRYSVGDPDVDGILVKHLLDVLQPMHLTRCPDGLGIISGDSRLHISLISDAVRVAHKTEQCTVVVIEGDT